MSFPFYDDSRAQCAVGLDEDDDFDETMASYEHGSSIPRDADIAAMNKNAPDASKWKDQTGPVRIGVDDARYRANIQADLEFQSIKKQLEVTEVDDGGNVHNTRLPTINELQDRFFGAHSQMYQLFHRKIGLTHEQYLLFLGTFYYTCAIDMGLADMINEDEIMKTEIFMPIDEYMATWKLISEVGLPKEGGDGSTVGHRGAKEFWREVEDALNDFLRETFVLGYDKNIDLVATIDDDKQHFQTARSLGGPKLTQHVRDNRRGFTCHQMVMSASLLLIGARYEGRGDTTNTTTLNMIKTQLAPAEGTNSNQMLQNCYFNFDRGYMGWSHMIAICSMSGGLPSGTEKRAKWFPFTYRTKLAEGDNRVDVSEKGPRNLLRKEYTPSGCPKITGFAYVNGNGGVTLGLTTEHRQNEWDFVCRNPSDRSKYKDNEQRASLWFREINKQANYAKLIQELGKLTVEPMVAKDNTPPWFLGRALSETSSTSDRLIFCLSKAPVELLGEIGINADDWTILRGYLADKLDTSVQDELVSGQSSEFAAKMNVVLMLTDDSVFEAFHQRFQQCLEEEEEMEDEELQEWEKEVRSYIKILGGKSTGPYKKVRDLMKDWLATDKAKRPYSLRSHDSLSVEASERLSNFSKRGKKTDQIIDLLVAEDTRTGGVGSTTALSPRDQLRLNLVKRLLQSSFLPKLYGEGKEYCKRGHELEEPFAKALLEDSEKGLLDVDIKEIYRCGMSRQRFQDTDDSSDEDTQSEEERNERMHLSHMKKDSVDFVSIVCNKEARSHQSDDDSSDSEAESQLQPGRIRILEMKARLTPTTVQEAKDALRAAQLEEGAEHDQKYFKILAGSEKLRIYIPSSHEAIQILHHALHYNADEVMLVIGDNSGRIIMGVTVVFPERLRLAYDNVLSAIGRFALMWAYKPDYNIEEDSIVCRAIQSLGMDMADFKVQLELWRFFSTKMDLPVPDIARIVPLVIAVWNAYKGGSDSLTKLIDSVGFQVPVNQSQPVVVGRLLLMLMLTYFRSLQVCTMKDFKSYKSLRSCRRAASKRHTFPRTLREVGRALMKAANPAPSPGSALHLSLAGLAFRTEGRTTRKRARVEEVPSIVGKITGSTPVRGVYNWYRGTGADSDVAERQRKCTGIIVYQSEPSSCRRSKLKS